MRRMSFSLANCSKLSEMYLLGGDEPPWDVASCFQGEGGGGGSQMLSFMHAEAYVPPLLAKTSKLEFVRNEIIIDLEAACSACSRDLLIAQSLNFFLLDNSSTHVELHKETVFAVTFSFLLWQRVAESFCSRVTLEKLWNYANITSPSGDIFLSSPQLVRRLNRNTPRQRGRLFSGCLSLPPISREREREMLSDLWVKETDDSMAPSHISRDLESNAYRAVWDESEGFSAWSLCFSAWCLTRDINAGGALTVCSFFFINGGGGGTTFIANGPNVLQSVSVLDRCRRWRLITRSRGCPVLVITEILQIIWRNPNPKLFIAVYIFTSAQTV